MVVGTELMPSLVVGVFEAGGSKSKNGKGKRKPNFELAQNPVVEKLAHPPHMVILTLLQ